MLTHAQAQFHERSTCINCGSTHLTELSRGRFTDQPLRGFIEDDPGGKDVTPHLQDAEWILVKCSCQQVFHRRILNNEWNQKRFISDSAEAILEFETRMAKKRGTTQSDVILQRAKGYITHALRIEALTRPLRIHGEPVRVLDFGCGWGGFISACKVFGFEAYGVDRSEARIDGADIIVAPSIEQLPDKRPFHAITLFEVLEHVDDPASILCEVSNSIVSGGILVLETPDCSGVTGITTHDEYRKIHPIDHINAFTHDTLISITERFGFKRISRPACHVTADRSRLVRTEIKHLIGHGEASTQLYFAKQPH